SSSASRPDKLNASASPKIDIGLTLSIPYNCLPPNPLRVLLRENFDTLSVYRGLLCEQVAHASNARLSNLQRLTRHEKSTNSITSINSINPPTQLTRLPGSHVTMQPL